MRCFALIGWVSAFDHPGCAPCVVAPLPRASPSNLCVSCGGVCCVETLVSCGGVLCGSLMPTHALIGIGIRLAAWLAQWLHRRTWRHTRGDIPPHLERAPQASTAQDTDAATKGGAPAPSQSSRMRAQTTVSTARSPRPDSYGGRTAHMRRRAFAGSKKGGSAGVTQSMRILPLHSPSSRSTVSM